MTAKRFTLKGFDGVRCDLFDGDVELAEVHKEDAKELCNLLNELHEENQGLKERLKHYKNFVTNNMVDMRKEYLELSDLVDELHEENDQLKKEIKEKEEVIKFYHRFNRGVDDDL